MKFELAERTLACRNEGCPMDRVTLPLNPEGCHKAAGRWPTCPVCGSALYFTDTFLAATKRTKTKHGRVRDSQRSKVYKAEREAFANCNATMFREDYSLRECQQFADRVAHSKTWAGLPDSPWVTRGSEPWTKVYVKDGRGSPRARARMNTVMVPTWARNKPTMIHELAHVATPGGVGAHGPEFCRNYIALASRFLGERVATELKKAFRRNRVKFQKPKAMTPEQMFKLKERGRALAAKRKGS